MLGNMSRMEMVRYKDLVRKPPGFLNTAAQRAFRANIETLAKVSAILAGTVIDKSAKLYVDVYAMCLASSKPSFVPFFLRFFGIGSSGSVDTRALIISL